MAIVYCICSTPEIIQFNMNVYAVYVYVAELPSLFSRNKPEDRDHTHWAHRGTKAGQAVRLQPWKVLNQRWTSYPTAKATSKERTHVCSRRPCPKRISKCWFVSMLPCGARLWPLGFMPSHFPTTYSHNNPMFIVCMLCAVHQATSLSN